MNKNKRKRPKWMKKEHHAFIENACKNELQFTVDEENFITSFIKSCGMEFLLDPTIDRLRVSMHFHFNEIFMASLIEPHDDNEAEDEWKELPTHIIPMYYIYEDVDQYTELCPIYDMLMNIDPVME